MTYLENCTLVCIDTKNQVEALKAMDICLDEIIFLRSKFFTTSLDGIKLDKFKNIKQIEIIQIPEIKNKADYSKFCLVELPKNIVSDFCLTIQHDGYIIDSSCWTNNFMKFDYIGAPWPPEWGYKNRVGNGGFCLKSKKFLNISYDIFKDFDFNSDLNRSIYDISVNEDFLSCNIYYDEFIKGGIKFADEQIAALFSIEHPVPEMTNRSFGFHGNFTRRRYEKELFRSDD